MGWCRSVSATRLVNYKPAQAIVQGLRKNGHQQPIIGFPKGFGDGLIQYAEESGVDAIGIDHGVDPGWAGKIYQKIFLFKEI